MAVYVDSMQSPYRSMIMCHMMADTTEELIAMADKIRVRRKWIQDAGTPREYFDICLTKRRLAILNGAKELGWRGMSQLLERKRNESC